MPPEVGLIGELSALFRGESGPDAANGPVLNERYHSVWGLGADRNFTTGLGALHFPRNKKRRWEKDNRAAALGGTFTARD